MENKKRKFFKRKGFWVIAIVVVILFIAMSGEEDSSTVNQENTESVSDNEKDKTDIETKKERRSEKDKSDNAEEDVDDNDTISEFTPADFLEELQENEAYPYELSERADKFLNNNPSLFPIKKKSKIKKYIDYSIDYRHLTKNSSKYGDKLMALEGASVVDCKEENVDDDTVITELQLCDNDANNFIVFYFGELPDVLEEDPVDCYGLPLGTTAFDNVSGGTTLAGVLAGSYIKKIN